MCPNANLKLTLQESTSPGPVSSLVDEIRFTASWAEYIVYFQLELSIFKDIQADLASFIVT